ncbi:MAG TPA: Arm DNA-binding domain-containing protein [Xanthobacteraceae bacterium]|nr:Arm DNA-binding domain-containing protein [Xanthobacteraceae bacterium]
MTNDESKGEFGGQDAAAPSGVQPSASSDIVETTARSDLIWDDEARGLCIRVYPDGSRLFIFVYRISDRQRFIRIGRSPRWSLEAARLRVKEFRSSIDQGCDPADQKREDSEIAPVEDLMRYIAEELK